VTDAWAPPTPKPKRRHALLVPVLALALAGAGFGTYQVVRDEDLEWDPNLASLATFVENERGLSFEHPVRAEFLADDEWTDWIRTEESDLTEDDRREMEEAVAFLRALGLAEGDVDLLEEQNDLSTEFFVAFFDPATDRIYVHGDDSSDLDVATRATLVHELTHALQHQHFDLEAMVEEADQAAQLAQRGLIEGDAMNVEDAWVATLSDADQDEYFRTLDEFDDPSTDVPAALAVTAATPYALGPALASMLDRRGELNDAFTDGPTTDEHLLDPISFIEGDEPEDVVAPELPDDAEQLDEGEFGAISLFTVLAERIDASIALDAADGWGGDEYLTYRSEGRTCVRVRTVGESKDDTERIVRALSSWIETLPEPFATVRVDGSEVLLESCDPGSDIDLATGTSYDALELVATRGGLEDLFLADDLAPAQARCMANGFLDEFTIEELQTDDPQFAEELQERAFGVAGSCF